MTILQIHTSSSSLSRMTSTEFYTGGDADLDFPSSEDGEQETSTGLPFTISSFNKTKFRKRDKYAYARLTALQRTKRPVIVDVEDLAELSAEFGHTTAVKAAQLAYGL